MAKKKKTKKAKKRELDFGEAKKKQKELEDRSSGDYHSVEEGWNWYYVCPPWSDVVKVLWREIQQHGLNLVCPKNSGYDKDCLICKERKKALKKGDTDFADEFRLSSRGFMNAIKKSDIKRGGPVKILAVSAGVFEAIVDHVTDEKINISDPEAAVLVGIKRKGKGFKTKYSTIKFSDPVNISKYLDLEKLYEELWDLDTVRGAQPASLKTQRTAIRKFVKGDDVDADEADFDDEDFDLASDGEEDGFEGESEEDEMFGEPDDEDLGDDSDEDLDDELDLSDDEELDEDLELEEEEPEPPKKKGKSKKKAGKSGKAGKADKKASAKKKRRSS